ncbi:MAG TPA: ABC-2 family transporter protein [Vitreimonas sp.]|nr:ABC-2 family transporter protein [Vitreimonas sp.]
MVLMIKYWYIFKLAWQNSFVYRTSLFIWRFRQFLSTVMALTVWNVIFNSQASAFGYTQSEMAGYVLLISLLQSLILASSLHGLAGEIYSGGITHHFLKPEKLFLSFGAVEAADKLKNAVFSCLEIGILWLIFKPSLLIPSLGIILLFSLWVLAGILIHFYITILFGTLGFWTPDSWGPKFLFFMFLDFTAGKLYPLDIFPTAIQQLILLTPFPYFSYVQIQLFLQRLDLGQIYLYSFGLAFWTVLSWWLAHRAWKKGLSGYEATGQ